MGPGEKVVLGASMGCGNEKTVKVSPIIAVRTRENHPNIVNSEVDSSKLIAHLSAEEIVFPCEVFSKFY